MLFKKINNGKYLLNTRVIYYLYRIIFVQLSEESVVTIKTDRRNISRQRNNIADLAPEIAALYTSW